VNNVCWGISIGAGACEQLCKGIKCSFLINKGSSIWISESMSSISSARDSEYLKVRFDRSFPSVLVLDFVVVKSFCSVHCKLHYVSLTKI